MKPRVHVGGLAVVILLMASLVACGSEAPLDLAAVMPSNVGAEHFIFTSTNGNALTDDNYDAFYAAFMKEHARARSDLRVQLAAGSRQTLVTVVSVEGLSESSFEAALSKAAYPAASATATSVSGITVTEIRQPDSDTPIWIFQCRDSACVIDTANAGQRKAIFSLLAGKAVGP
jgi:hypothetical protein